ncbi:hypothetical protein Tco_0623157 [Tanacetum coccineum]
MNYKQPRLECLDYSGDIVDWEFLSNKGLAQPFFDFINIDTFFRPQWVNLFQINEPIFRELVCEFFASFEFNASPCRFNVVNTKEKSIRDPKDHACHLCITMESFTGGRKIHSWSPEIELCLSLLHIGEGVFCNIPIESNIVPKSVRDKRVTFGGMFVTRIAWSFGFLTNEMVIFVLEKTDWVSQQVLKQQVSWDIAGETAVLLRFVKNSAASILSTAKVVTYYVVVHKKVFFFVLGDDVVRYRCDLIEYFMIMVVIVLLSLVSTASYVLVLPVFTLYCQRKLALFEFKDEFLCYWISAIKEERKQMYMLRSWKPNCWLTSPIGLKDLMLLKYMVYAAVI